MEISFPVDLSFKTRMVSLPQNIGWILNKHLSIPWGWTSSQSWDETGLATCGCWRGCLFKSSTQGSVSRAGFPQHFWKSSEMACLDSLQRTFWKLVNYYEEKKNNKSGSSADFHDKINYTRKFCQISLVCSMYSFSWKGSIICCHYFPFLIFRYNYCTYISFTLI